MASNTCWCLHLHRAWGLSCGSTLIIEKHLNRNMKSFQIVLTRAAIRWLLYGLRFKYWSTSSIMAPAPIRNPDVMLLANISCITKTHKMTLKFHGTINIHWSSSQVHWPVSCRVQFFSIRLFSYDDAKQRKSLELVRKWHCVKTIYYKLHVTEQLWRTVFFRIVAHPFVTWRDGLTAVSLAQVTCRSVISLIIHSLVYFTNTSILNDSWNLP